MTLTYSTDHEFKPATILMLDVNVGREDERSAFTSSATFCNIFRIWAKCKQTQYLIDKSILGKMGGVYVTYVADVDKGQ